MNIENIIVILLLCIFLLMFKEIIKIALSFIFIALVSSMLSNFFGVDFYGSVLLSISMICLVNILVNILKSMLETIAKPKKIYKKELKGKLSILFYDLIYMLLTFVYFSITFAHYLKESRMSVVLNFILILLVSSVAYKFIREMLNKFVLLPKAVIYIKDEVELDKDLLRLKTIAYKDALTGVKNRVSYEEEVQRINSSRGHTDGLCVVAFDINFLKKINDELGHEQGDLYIKDCVNVILTVFDRNVVYRIGGDEFIVLLKNSTVEDLDKKLSTMEYNLNATNKTRTIPLSVAYGYCFSNDTHENLSDIIKEADFKMYENKRMQKNKM